MPPREKVSLTRQTIYVLIPILDLVAFYKIQHLRKYLLIVYVGVFGFIGSVYAWFIHPESWEFNDNYDPNYFMNTEYWILEIPMMVISATIAVFLVRLWSKRWNLQLNDLNTNYNYVADVSKGVFGKPKPVNLGWQIIFVLVPWVWIYAFGRIKQLTKGSGFMLLSWISLFVSRRLPDEMEYLGGPLMILAVIGQVLGIIFVIIWSKKWNKQFGDETSYSATPV